MSPPRQVRLALAAATALLGISVLSPAAFAGWSVDPTQVHATTNDCPQVAAANDGAYGAIVLWQETTADPNGPLYARHVLPDGTLDSAWPSPATVCATLAARSALGAVADGLGGAYVWWMSGTNVFLSRVAPNGSIAAGWPAGGRMLGSVVRAEIRPDAFSDGAHGVYIEWLQPDLFSGSGMMLPTIRAAHLGPANTAAGGWPAGGLRTLGTTLDAYEWVNSAAIGLSPDGGLWLAWATTIVDAEAQSFLPGDVRLTRLTAAGVASPGWDGHGVSIAPFNGPLLYDSAWWGLSPKMSLVGVAADGGDGAYVMRGEPTEDGFYGIIVDPRLSHLLAGGVADPVWPAGGIQVSPGALPISADVGAGGSYRAAPDGSGGVFASRPWEAADSPGGIDFRRYSAAAVALAGGAGGGFEGFEFTLDGAGGMYAASYHSTGPYSAWDQLAYIHVDQAPSGAGYAEYHDTPVTYWYGDIALAPSGDGGAFFFWSQHRDRFGVYGVRLNGAGQVTAVTPAPAAAPRGLALRFARGAGVQARASFAAAGPARWQLLDVAGRVLAESDVAVVAGENSWTMSGTAALPSGLYFGRVVRGAEVSRAKVAIVR